MPQHKGRFSVPHPEGADVANAGEAAGIDTPQVYAFVTGAVGSSAEALGPRASAVLAAQTLKP